MIPESAVYYPEIPVPAVHLPSAGAFGPPLIATPCDAFIASINGTGSNCSIVAFRDRQGGYALFPIEQAARTSEDLSKRYVKLIDEIQGGFDRTFSRLPTVFGVSRQTLYNWRKGETPKPQHEAKLAQLAAAAREFAKVNLTPTSAMLDRTVADGKSFLTLLAEGADGVSTARTLIRIVQRGLISRARLEKALEGVPARPTEPSDFSAPAFKEDV
jgi:hypothetical protein